MANSYYTRQTDFVPATTISSAEVDNEYNAIVAAFDLLPTSPSSLATNTMAYGSEAQGATVNEYVVTMPNTRTSNAEGDEVVFKATHTNTGSPTTKIDALGAVAITNVDGTAVVAGDIVSGSIYEMRFTGSVFQLTSSAPFFVAVAAASAADSAQSADSAEQWAIRAEDDPVPIANGGDGSTTFSSLHWSAKSDGAIDARIATQMDVDTGVSTTLLVTPATLDGRAASETITGLAEIATQAEVDAGLDTTRYVTPLTFANKFATETRFGVVEIADAAEIDAGTEDNRVISAQGLTLRTATETRTGIAELATQTEVDAGTDTSRIVTPATLTGRVATETLAGIAELATQAEVDTGTDTSKIVTPATLQSNLTTTLQSKVKTTTHSLTPVTFTDDPDLAGFVLEANSRYHVRLFLQMTLRGAGAAWRMDFSQVPIITNSGTGVFSDSAGTVTSPTSAVFRVQDVEAAAGEQMTQSATTGVVLEVNFTFTSNASTGGTLTLQMAEIADVGGASPNVQDGSFMQVEKFV